MLFSMPLLAGPKEIASDKAVFRVAEEIVFISDLQEISKTFEKIRCLKTDGLMLNLLELDKKSQPKFPSFKKFDFNDQSNKDFIQKIILFKKAGHFIETQSIVFESPLKSLIEKDSCIAMKYSDWSLDLKRFFDLEIYVQKRYVAIKEKGSKENLKSIQNSVKLFLSSLSQKIPHYVFY